MEKDKLIDAILQEVFRKLENENILVKKKVITVNFSKEEKEILENTYSSEYVFEHLHKIYRGVEADIVYVGELDFDDLALMAQGRNTSFGHIMELIMQGKPVVMPRSALTYLNYKDTCPVNLFAMYRSYENYLKKIGIIFIDSLEENPFSKEEKAIVEQSLQTSSEVISKKVIRESDILELLLSNKKEVKILNNSIITPLAMDVIKENKMLVIRKWQWRKAMKIGKVVGNVWATKKETSLEGLKLLVVQLYDPTDNKNESCIVAVDTVGAGTGEDVLVVSGSSARAAMTKDKIPVDATIVGIIDEVEIY